MENLCLEDIWRENLLDKGWSNELINRLDFSLAKGTFTSYNNVLGKLYVFCADKKCLFPPSDTCLLAEFFSDIAKRSTRPSSVLRTSLAAIGHLYKAKEQTNLVEDHFIRLFITGLVKSGTTTPMTKSKVMPIRNFNDMFSLWPCNQDLDEKRLRLKCITLLALTLMLRPSDIAPNGRILTADGDSSLINFSTDQLQFCDGYAKVTFFGIKNDTSRTGFEVVLPAGNNSDLDPVSCLKCYIERTQKYRAAGGPVFIGLKHPRGALKAASIAKILDESIVLAGLDGQGYSAKSFRPTGATTAIAENINPEIVRKVGRWKSSEVFFTHYVHSQTPADFTDLVLGHE